ncbi:MAG: ankyrin repeat domain-containing protein [Cyanobacteriota bacterium]
MRTNFFKNTKNLLFYSVIFALITSIYSCNPINNINLNKNDAIIKSIKSKNYQNIYDNIKLVSKYINEKDEFGKTPLMLATEENNLPLVKFLLENGADINLENKSQNTALNIAILNKNKETINFLVKNNANLKIRNADYDFPIILAARNNDTETIKLLIDKGVDVDSRELNGKSLLHFACMFENKELIELILNKGAIIEQSRLGYPIELLNKLEIINFFVDKLSNKNLDFEHDYISIFKFLIGRTNNSVIKKFINKIENYRPKSINTNDAFILSISEKNKELIDFFFDKVDNINFVNSLNDTPLITAIRGNNSELIKAIINKGANVNLSGSQGWTPLMQGIKNNNIDVIKLLIKNNANINLYTNSNIILVYENKDIFIDTGLSPLMISIMTNNFEIFKTLIEAGADVNLKDSEGHNALAYTTTNFLKDNEKELKRDMAKILIEKGSLLKTEFKFEFRGGNTVIHSSFSGQIDENFKGGSFVEYVINDLEFLELIAKKMPNTFALPMNNLGYTPLIFALNSGSNLDILEFIIKQTKNINLVDNENKTALDHAIKSSKKEVIDLLKQYGAK